MELSAAHRQIIARANQLGWFPTPAQAKKIANISAYRYGTMIDDGIVAKGRVDDRASTECMNGAIRAVMDPTYFQVTMINTGGESLAGDAAEAIQKAAGKRIRVRIEEW